MTELAEQVVSNDELDRILGAYEGMEDGVPVSLTLGQLKTIAQNLKDERQKIEWINDIAKTGSNYRLHFELQGFPGVIDYFDEILGITNPGKTDLLTPST